jgi:hypothetical protein
MMMNLLNRFARVGVVLAMCGVSVEAAVEVPGLDYFLPGVKGYDAKVPKPAEYLGFEMGEWHLQHHELVGYMQKLAERSERVKLVEYARSHGRRPLLMLMITSPKNHGRLEEIRKAHVARALGAKDAKVEEPLVVTMGYGIHGNEPSATHAGVVLAYHLAADPSAETVKLLEQTVVLLDPCLNPDGFERFSSWSNAFRGQHPSAHRREYEHAEGWPSGRSNYYWFDLNRDWLPAVHPESKGRLKFFHEWMPNVVTDYHEMGNVNSSYFFQPGIAKMVHPNTPEENQALTLLMAESHAKALDGMGSLYYAGESFDDFYIGKGSTYPDVNGSVGVLFEQASSRGFHQDTEHGRLTFAFTIRNQLATSLSTLRSVHGARGRFLAYQKQFFVDALAAAREDEVKAYVLSAGGDRARLLAFKELMDLHQIENWMISGKPAGKAVVQAGAGDSLVVPLEQRQYGLLKTIFEKRTTFASHLFYDVSAWHLPSAYGLQVAEAKEMPNRAQEAKGRVRAQLLGEKGEGSVYAYAFQWSPRFAPRALFRLLTAGVRCKVATKPFVLRTGSGSGKARYARGSIVVPLGIQDPAALAELEGILKAIVEEDLVDVQVVRTGMNDGVPSLGSPSFFPVEDPRVALVVGEGASSIGAGEVWHQFDQVWKTGLTKVKPESVTGRFLRDHKVLILAGTSVSALSTSGRSALQSWLSAGGTVIGIGGSAVSGLAAQSWCGAETLKKPVEVKKSGEVLQKTMPYGDAAEVRASKELNGVIVQALFDATHPLAYGYDRAKSIALMRDGTTFLKAATSHYLTPLVYPEEALVAGSASEENLKRMAGSTPLQVHPVGDGRVVLFTDNPVFRGHWLGTEKLLANAIFFARLVGSSGGGAEE